MDVTLGYALQTLILSIKRREMLLLWARHVLDPYLFEVPITPERDTQNR
jgi:hypothetical protein